MRYIIRKIVDVKDLINTLNFDYSFELDILDLYDILFGDEYNCSVDSFLYVEIKRRRSASYRDEEYHRIIDVLEKEFPEDDCILLNVY